MSTLRVDDITDAAGTGSPTFSNGIDFGAKRGVWKRKFLTVNQTSTGVITDVTFTNIESGKLYRLDLHMVGTVGSNGRLTIRVKQGAAIIGRIDIQNGDSSPELNSSDLSLIYVSPNTTDITAEVITLSGGSSPEVAGDGTLDGTWFQIEEIDSDFINPTETTKWD